MSLIEGNDRPKPTESQSASHPTDPSHAQCPICRRTMPLTRAGLIRVHGPVEDRCPGLRKPPSSLPLRENIPAQDFRPRRPSVSILKCIPQASRDLSARKLASILNLVTTDNTVASWDRLFHFASRCLRVPKRGGHCRSLACHVNQMIREEVDPEVPQQNSVKQRRRPARDPLETLAIRVASKLKEGDFKGAVHLASLEDSVAESSDRTLQALKEKHPAPYPNYSPPPAPAPTEGQAVQVSPEEMAIGLSGSFLVGQQGAQMGFAHNTSKT